MGKSDNKPMPSLSSNMNNMILLFSVVPPTMSREGHVPHSNSTGMKRRTISSEPYVPSLKLPEQF